MHNTRTWSCLDSGCPCAGSPEFFRTCLMNCSASQCETKVKNVGADLRLHRREADLPQCRAIRNHCQSVKFCCRAHLDKCKSGAGSGVASCRGGREVLDAAQMTSFIDELIRNGPVWPAIMLMIQLCMGERADAVRRARVKWFEDIEAEALGAPFINIPKVNGKTVARKVPLPVSVAIQIHSWMHKSPLKNSHGQQWPFPGQQVSRPDALLFPGMARRGRARCWSRAVTTRSYLKMLKNAACRIGCERTMARLLNDKHLFDDVALDKIGTHTIKKTMVTSLKAAKYSTAVVSAITGTHARTLDSVYDVPTAKRQRHAINDIIVPALNLPHAPKPATAAVFCCHCGAQRQVVTWQFCHQCGQRVSG